MNVPGRVLVLAALAVVAAACGGGSEQVESGSTLPGTWGAVPTPASLVGTWTRIGTAGLIQFAADREFRIARSTVDLVEAPFAVGRYRVAGTRIELTGGCTSVWNAGLPDEDELKVVVVEAGCGLDEGLVLTFAKLAE